MLSTIASGILICLPIRRQGSSPRAIMPRTVARLSCQRSASWATVRTEGAKMAGMMAFGMAPYGQ
jgi:hypothetical protein